MSVIDFQPDLFNGNQIVDYQSSLVELCLESCLHQSLFQIRQLGFVEEDSFVRWNTAGRQSVEGWHLASLKCFHLLGCRNQGKNMKLFCLGVPFQNQLTVTFRTFHLNHKFGDVNSFTNALGQMITNPIIWSIMYNCGAWRQRNIRPYSHIGQRFPWLMYISVPRVCLLNFGGHQNRSQEQPNVFPSYSRAWLRAAYLSSPCVPRLSVAWFPHLDPLRLLRVRWQEVRPPGSLSTSYKYILMYNVMEVKASIGAENSSVSRTRGRGALD